MRIGILAVQGDFEAHARMLGRVGAEHEFVLTPQQAEGVDAMILPGGESTTMLKFLEEEGLAEPLRNLAARGAAFFGTCAGAILMAREVRGPAQASLGLADLVITRNGYGRQLASEVRLAASKLKAEPLEMVFIRAPIIEQTGPGVEVLASDRGHAVLVRDGRMLLSTFHPELSDDTTVHEYFLKMAAQPAAAAASRGGRGEPRQIALAQRCGESSRLPAQHPPKKTKKKVLFICLGNACRSQMAEALARHLAADVIEASSAGLAPLGYIAEPTSAVLAERGVGCEGQTSKPVLREELAACDLVVNMSGRPVKKLFDPQEPTVEDWDVGDPFGSDLEIYRNIRDEIERRVMELAGRLRASAKPHWRATAGKADKPARSH